jgi:hypothetical protein
MSHENYKTRSKEMRIIFKVAEITVLMTEQHENSSLISVLLHKSVRTVFP